MADRTKIEWSEATWNPVTGCDKVSPGCDHCYAETIATRFKGSKAYPDGFAVTLHPDRLDHPLRWTRPRRIFVNSMSDLFHDDIPDAYIVKVFDAMGNADWHTFQVLTKRHARMRSFVTKYTAGGFGEPGRGGCGPLPNVWLGVSVEDQKRADLRIPVLLDTPAAVRWISAEPLLGPIDLSPWIIPWNRAVKHSKENPSHVLGPYDQQHLDCDSCDFDSQKGGIDWVVVGGESGPRARPMHPDWARGLRDLCVAVGVSFFFKQWGEWLPLIGHREFLELPPARTSRDWDRPFGDDVTMCRVGKRAAGRELDGRTWDEYPEGASS